MELPDFTVDNLKQLPLRAIVAFASRCARRVEHLAQLPEGDPGREGRRIAVDAAIRLAEQFAGGVEHPPDHSVVEGLDAIRDATSGPLSSLCATVAAASAAHAAASARDALATRATERYKPFGGSTADARSFGSAIEHASVDLAALDAFTAAVEASGAVGYHNENFVAAALDDYERLLRLNLGHYPEPGELIDPTPGGPLGPL
jgi:hypothetical protein